MKKASLLFLAILFVFGCGVRKKNLVVKKTGSAIEQKTDIVTDINYSVNKIDTSKIVIKSKEDIYISITEMWVWNKDGNPESFTRTVKESLDRGSEESRDNYIGIISDSTAKITDLSVLKQDSTHYSKDLSKESKPEASSWLKWLAIVLIFLTVALITIRKTL